MKMGVLAGIACNAAFWRLDPVLWNNVQFGTDQAFSSELLFRPRTVGPKCEGDSCPESPLWQSLLWWVQVGSVALWLNPAVGNGWVAFYLGISLSLPSLRVFFVFPLGAVWWPVCPYVLLVNLAKPVILPLLIKQFSFFFRESPAWPRKI